MQLKWDVHKSGVDTFTRQNESQDVKDALKVKEILWGT
jgi:hypothetical protein